MIVSEKALELAQQLLDEIFREEECKASTCRLCGFLKGTKTKGGVILKSRDVCGKQVALCSTCFAGHQMTTQKTAYKYSDQIATAMWLANKLKRTLDEKREYQ